jgi:hypothetical protein
MCASVWLFARLGLFAVCVFVFFVLCVSVCLCVWQLRLLQQQQQLLLLLLTCLLAYLSEFIC